MRQTRKGTSWYFGMKCHVGTDPQGFVHTMTTTDAAHSDIGQLPHLVHGLEETLHGDKAYSVHDPEFLERFDVLERAAPGAMVLLNVAWAPDDVWSRLPVDAQRVLVERKARLFVIDGTKVADAAGLGPRVNTVMQVCFFALSNVIPRDEAIAHIKDSIAKTWGKRGPEVVRRNVEAVDAALAELHEVPVPAAVSTTRVRRPTVPAAPDFVQRVTRLMLDGHGDTLPVSAFPIDGTWPTGTSQYEKRAIALEIPIWESDVCVQCNRCSMICPHAAIRTKVYEPEALGGAPADFLSVPEAYTAELKGLQYTGAGGAGRLHGVRTVRGDLPREGSSAAQAQGDQHEAAAGTSRAGSHTL